MFYDHAAARHVSYQAMLTNFCLNWRLSSPRWYLCSEQRGRRTAWSGHIIIGRLLFSCRFWYDGNYIKNAEHEAAEFALKYLEYSRFNNSDVWAMAMEGGNRYLVAGIMFVGSSY
ncbi:hypothetical protein EJ05DRAFT_346085 [Pseudovirgaria hyperparasitica]|uniref:DRBM domain-containing protein n=1 Tax=Pseudovirgaria hyperparasitica TaxID=470096 RepID=A0A6A6VT67_9PEZI|nr:uncharacterized protein EJ05DRAFT_346085 [Pseudovirgaria hyperparasitica]KAF2752437.1 hypothetical protein EJ05DRAFT_346085 [Pseudovirgaria hyperparasitica]